MDRLKITLADRYAMEREIGAGGMAAVFRGWAETSTNRVA